MASPPSINKSLLLPRITQFKEVGDVQKWCQNLLRSLEQQFQGSGTGGSGGGPLAGSLAQGTNIIQPTAYPYTPAFSDLIVLVDTSAPRTINLPGVSLGFTTSIKDVTGTASTNNITVTPVAPQKIEGAASYAIAVNRQSILVLGTGIVGNEWVVF